MFHTQVIHAQGNVPKVTYREFPGSVSGSSFVDLDFDFRNGFQLGMLFANVDEARLLGQHILNATEPFMRQKFVDPAMA